jgi:hypothetical protein
MPMTCWLNDWRQADVLVVSVTGLVTKMSPQTIRAYAAELLRRQPARAVVCDLRGAVLALTAEDWGASVEAAEMIRLQLPVALVVDEECMALAEEYAQLLCHRGHFRVVFKSFSRAYAWASSRLDVLVPASSGHAPAPRAAGSLCSARSPRRPPGTRSAAGQA